MKIAVIYFQESPQHGLLPVAKAIADGLAMQGRQVDCIDGYREDIRGGMYQYICLVVQSKGLFTSKPTKEFSKALANASGLSGKRTCLFVKNKTLLANKFIQRTMNALESEGLFMRNTLLSSKISEFKAYASTLNVDLLPRP